MKTLALTKAVPFLRNLHGQFFSVTFTKKDGTVRKMTCRMSVGKGVKGGGYSHTKDIARQNITVWDAAKFAHRAVPLNRVLSLKARGNTYQIVSD